VAKSPDLAHVELMIERACGIVVLANQVIGSVNDGLPQAGGFVLRGDDDETPGSHVLEQIIVLAGDRIASVPPGQNGMQEAVRA